ncbi:MAG: alkaline phosphatase family protein, partial [Gemmatimonadetes bacterium]|nr:alkaline phosphatase family protein [Gemmatimonadota bacterium]
PTLERLMRTGVRETLHSLPPGPAGEERLSPTIWTSAVTGMMPEKHGILHFVAPGPDGRMQPVTSNQRRAAALWNMATARGLDVGVIGWLATWPAEPVQGYLVSSYTPYIFKWSSDPAGRPIKGTLVTGVPDQVYPPELQPVLEGLKVAPDSVDDRRLEARFTRHELPGVRDEDLQKSLDGMRWSWAADQTYLRAYEWLAAHPPTGRRPDLELAYFASVDVISHRFWKYMEPDTYALGDVDPADVLAFGQSVESAYRCVDGVLGEVLGLEPDSSRVIVLSDHGFQENRDRQRTTSSGWHRPQGILLANGPGFRRGEHVGEGSVVDVAPTVLYALGLPIGADMDGKPALDLFEDDVVKKRAPEEIPSWEPEVERARAEAPKTSPVDREILERLKTIGYI